MPYVYYPHIVQELCPTAKNLIIQWLSLPVLQFVFDIVKITDTIIGLSTLTLSYIKKYLRFETVINLDSLSIASILRREQRLVNGDVSKLTLKDKSNSLHTEYNAIAINHAVD